jgi:Na+/proline symporter
MSKPNIIGLISVAIVIASAFLPWLTIESKHLAFTGMNTAGSSFGEPGKLNIIVAVMAALLFLSPNKWMARINLFVTAFLAAWTFRNFVLFSRCEMGECPEREIGLYLSLLAAAVSFVCVIFSNGNKKPARPA